MLNELENYPVFAHIVNALDAADGVLEDAWVDFEGKRWHPVLITDRNSKQRGFEINTSGTRGPSSEVGRIKVDLASLLQMLAEGALPAKALIRCKQPNGVQRNGRHVTGLKTSPRLSGLLESMRTTSPLASNAVAED